jgi:hypothetical protein
MRDRTSAHRLRPWRCGVALLLAGAATAAPAAAGDTATPSRLRPVLSPSAYFPLRPGYRWVYRAVGASGEVRTWEVRVLEQPAPSAPSVRSYQLLAGYFDDATRLVRSDAFGNVLERDGDARDRLWYRLGAPVGTSWTLSTAPPEPACLAGATLTVGARDEVVTVPAGEFRGVVRVDYSGSRCADAGITTEWFAPGVGLVRRAETTIAGALVSELVTAEFGETGWPRGAWEVALQLDAPVFVHNLMPPVAPEALARVRGALVVRNRGDQPVELVFSGCRSVTLELRDEAGTVVRATRADDGGCCACDNLVTVTLVRDALVLPFSFTLAGAAGIPLPDGRYGLTATLDTVGAEALRPAARTVITVQSVH